MGKPVGPHVTHFEVCYRKLTYQESWVQTDYFCMVCGRQTVWRDDSPGDYFAGNQHMCVSCGAAVYCNQPHTPDIRVDRHTLLRLAHLKAAQKALEAPAPEVVNA